MNRKKLRSAMMLYGDTASSLAADIGISSQRFSAKINEKDGAEFTQSEIDKISKRYKFTPDDIYDIFFAMQVS